MSGTDGPGSADEFPRRRRRRADHVVGAAGQDGVVPVDDDPARPRDGFSGLAMTGALPLDGTWLGVEPAAPVAGSPLAAAQPATEPPARPDRSERDVWPAAADPVPHWTTVSPDVPAAVPTAPSARQEQGGRALTVLDLASLERQADFDPRREATPDPYAGNGSGYQISFDAGPGRGPDGSDGANGSNGSDDRTYEHGYDPTGWTGHPLDHHPGAGSDTPSGYGWGTDEEQAYAAGGYPSAGYELPLSAPLDGPRLDVAPFDGQPFDGQPFDGQPFDGQPLDAQPLDVQPFDAHRFESRPATAAAADPIPAPYPAQDPLAGLPPVESTPVSSWSSSSDWGMTVTGQDPRAAAEWWGTPAPAPASNPLSALPSPSPVPLTSAPIRVRRPESAQPPFPSGAPDLPGTPTASLPTAARPEGEDPRTGAIRLAEAAGSLGDTANRRRILSTGPVMFDVDDEEPPRGRFDGATRPLRRRRPDADTPPAPGRTDARPPLTPPTPAEGLNAPTRPGQAPPGAGSRAGRNLPAAIGIGLLLAGTVLVSLLFRKEAFVGVVCAAAVLAVWELASVLAVKRIYIPVIPLAVGSLGMLVSAFVAREEGLLVSFTLTAFGVLLWRIIDGVEGAARDVAAAVFTAAYVPFLAGFSIIMLAAPDGAMRVVIFISVVVASDVGGYTAGVLFGKHPMAPTVSPKKSWEGLAGSVVLAMAVAVAGVVLLLHGPWWAGLAVGAAAATTATLGDLSESLLKRDLGVKDMGNLLPGHGGMMDRLDSLLPTAPAVYLILLLLVPSL